MPLIRIYACQDCEAVTRTPADAGTPVPVHCGHTMKWKQTRDYHPELHGRLTGETSAAIGFRHTSPWVVPMEGTGPDGQREVSSLREVRAIERATEQQERNGEGQAVRFRAFANDVAGGGMLTNTFGEPPQRAPKLFDAQGRQKISFDVVEGDAAEMGPGAEESLASALGGLD